MGRGRDRRGGNENSGRIREEVEHEERHASSNRHEDRTAGETPMSAIYAADSNGENRERIDCFGFEELARGVALYDGSGERIGYVPHESLIAIEPK